MSILKLLKSLGFRCGYRRGVNTWVCRRSYLGGTELVVEYDRGSDTLRILVPCYITVAGQEYVLGAEGTPILPYFGAPPWQAAGSIEQLLGAIEALGASVKLPGKAKATITITVENTSNKLDKIAKLLDWLVSNQPLLTLEAEVKAATLATTQGNIETPVTLHKLLGQLNTGSSGERGKRPIPA